MLENCFCVSRRVINANGHGTYVATSMHVCITDVHAARFWESQPRRTFSPSFQKTSDRGKSVLHSYETARPCAGSCDLASEMCGIHIDGNETVLGWLLHVNLATVVTYIPTPFVGWWTTCHSELQTAAGFLKFKRWNRTKLSAQFFNKIEMSDSLRQIMQRTSQILFNCLVPRRNYGFAKKDPFRLKRAYIGPFYA